MPDSKTTHSDTSTTGGEGKSRSGSTDPFADIRSLQFSALAEITLEDSSTQSKKTGTLIDAHVSEGEAQSLRTKNSARRERTGPAVTDVSK